MAALVTGGACRNIHEGDLVVHDGADLERLASLDQITGTLTIALPFSDQEIVVSNLQAIDGDLLIEASSAMLTFSDLTTVGGDIEAVQGIEDAFLQLDRFRVPCLRAVGGDLRVSNTTVRDVEFSRLESASAIAVEFNQRLTTLEMPALASASSVTISFNSMLCDSVADAIAARVDAPSESIGNAECGP